MHRPPAAWVIIYASLTVYHLTTAMSDRYSYIPIEALGFEDFGESLSECVGESWHGLYAHLDRLHGAQRDIGEELGRRAGRQVQRRSVQVRLFLMAKMVK